MIETVKTALRSIGLEAPARSVRTAVQSVLPGLYVERSRRYQQFSKLHDTLESFGDKQRPTLHVLGDIEHFQHSVLGRIAERKFTVSHVEDEPVAPSGGAGAWIKWSPCSRYKIPIQLRGKLSPDVRIINDTHFDCSKVTVQTVFEQVFGYSLKVDARSHSGAAVMKSNANASHDGRIVRLPVSDPSPDHVYERVIDNRVEDLVCDIRVPVVLGRTPFVYLKFRPVARRFSNANAYAKIVAAYDVLTREELALCQEFASSIGLEYGEIDVLRDRSDGRIYIVDANNTPHGPPNHIVGTERDVALRLLAQCVREAFFGN